MDENYSKGQRLFLETLDGTVEGVFHSVDPGHNKLTLKKVVLHPSGKQMDGLYHYYRNEVLNVRVLEPGSYTGVNKENEAAGNWNLMRKVVPSVHINKTPGRVTATDVVMNCMPGHGRNRPPMNRRSKLSEEEYDELNKLVQNHVLINHLGDVFKKALKDIKTERSIGLSVEGAMFGRCSKIGLVGISTPTWAFLFDVQTLGDAVFDNGLRDVLQSQEVEKVIHNCRLISDCLHHKHKVTLTNVFDTQVADLMVMQQKCGKFPRTVSSLPQCLTKYLFLPENLIFQPQIRAGYLRRDSLKWNIRPLPVELQVGAVKNSIFLLHLRKKILAEMMSTFHQGVELFLSIVRDADEEEVGEHQANDVLVPFELMSLGNQPIAQEKMENSIPVPTSK